MEELGLIPASENQWYVLTSPVTMVSALLLMEAMFEHAKELGML